MYKDFSNSLFLKPPFEGMEDLKYENLKVGSATRLHNVDEQTKTSTYNQN